MKQIDKTALLDWEKFKEDIDRATPVDKSMSAADREKHRRYLERHPVEWIKFFFPNYAKYEFADFQKRAIQRIIAHDEWFEVLSWSREPSLPSPCLSSCSSRSPGGRRTSS